MTSKEAKEMKISSITNSMKELIELIERDTPKKVVKEVDYRDIYTCSNCNNVLIIDRYQRLEDKDKINYCGECGQRLDWSEWEFKEALERLVKQTTDNLIEKQEKFLELCGVSIKEYEAIKKQMKELGWLE